MAILKNALKVVAGGAAGYVAASQIADRRALARNGRVAEGKRVVILGAGFAGQGVAQELCRLLPASANVQITLIDEDNYLLFTPMLTEAAGDEVDPRHIAVPVKELPSRVRFLQGRVSSIDLEKKQVAVEITSPGVPAEQTTVGADELVIALGSVTNFHNVPGAAEHSLTMKRLTDARLICERVLDSIERASSESDVEQRRKLLTFVVAGGGFTGVETMAAINDLARGECADRGLDKELRTILVSPTGRLLEETSEELAAYAEQKLREHGVDVRLNTGVASVDAGQVRLSSGETIQTAMFVWAAGVKPNAAIENLACEKGKHGGIRTSEACQVLQHPGVWALGDCAEIPSPNNKTYAPTAQNATREGKLVAANILRSWKGLAARPFRYKPIGELALVGKHAGVARIAGMNFSGFAAWAMWRAIYAAKLPSKAQRARVLLDWTMDLVFGREPVGAG